MPDPDIQDQDLNLGDDSKKTTPPVKQPDPPPAPPAPSSSTVAEPTSAKDIATAISATPTQTVAIVDLSNAVKSASTTADQVEKASTQSLDMQTGAQVAHGNAVQVLVKRWQAAVHHLGQEVAEEVRDALTKLHGAEEIVAKVFTDAGA